MKLLMLSILALSLIGCGRSEQEAVTYYQVQKDLTFKLGDMVSPKIFPDLRCTVSENLPEKKYDWMIDCNMSGKLKQWDMYDHELQVFQE